MLRLKGLFFCSLTALIWTISIFPVQSFVTKPTQLHLQPSVPFLTNVQQSSSAKTDKSLFLRFRDSIIRTIWSTSPAGVALTQSSALTQSPPSSLQARYGEDLVLRFTIESANEAAALAEAIIVLFLDVWEFTDSWVDIRLSKEVVSSGVP